MAGGVVVAGVGEVAAEASAVVVVSEAVVAGRAGDEKDLEP